MFFMTTLCSEPTSSQTRIHTSFSKTSLGPRTLTVRPTLGLTPTSTHRGALHPRRTDTDSLISLDMTIGIGSTRGGFTGRRDFPTSLPRIPRKPTSTLTHFLVVDYGAKGIGSALAGLTETGKRRVAAVVGIPESSWRTVTGWRASGVTNSSNGTRIRFTWILSCWRLGRSLTKGWRPRVSWEARTDRTTPRHFTCWERTTWTRFTESSRRNWNFPNRVNYILN